MDDAIEEWRKEQEVDEEYGGFKGETYATGHILEHYAMDYRKPKSMKGLE